MTRAGADIFWNLCKIARICVESTYGQRLRTRRAFASP